MEATPLIKPGSETSEFKLASRTKIANLVMTIGGAALMIMEPNAWPALIVAAIVAVAETFLSHGYTKGRSLVKVAASENPTLLPSPMPGS